MDREKLRSKGERDLAKILLSDPHLKLLIERYEKTKKQEAMRRLLLAGGVLVAAAEGGISEAELEALEGFLGEENLPRELNPDALRNDLEERIELARKNVPALRLAQVIRDLAVISLAGGHQHEEELTVIYEIAEKLDVERRVVERSIEAARAGLD